MRGRLLEDIARFHREAVRFLPLRCIPDATTLPAVSESPGAGWDSVEDSDVTGTRSPPLDPDANIDTPAEHRTIALPSHLGMSFCMENALQAAVRAERKLRIGQMNDALHHVRVAVGYKSLLYRTSHRAATTHRQKLRSFDEIHLADAEVLANARVYASARVAIQNLFAAEDSRQQGELQRLLEEYRVLQKADLKANTALIEHSVRGTSHTHLPWFWGLGMQKDSRSEGWLAECE